MDIRKLLGSMLIESDVLRKDRADVAGLYTRATYSDEDEEVSVT